jgi:hypothetical protein
MQPVGRTVSSDRGWFVNDLEEVKTDQGLCWEVEIARASNFFPGRRDFHRSWSNDTSLIGRDNFVLNAAPGDAATE